MLRAREVFSLVVSVRLKFFVSFREEKNRLIHFSLFCFLSTMTAVSDGSSPLLRGLVDAAVSAACEALAAAEEAEQVGRREERQRERQR